MALSFPKTPTNLQQYTDSNGIVWEYNSAKGIWSVKKDNQFGEFSGAKLQLLNPISLLSTESSLEWDSSDFDTNTYFNSISSPTKIIVPTTGYYRINVLLITGNAGNGASYTFSLKINGTTTIASDSTGPNTGVHFDEIYLLQDGDFIELYGSESGAVGTLETTSYFEIERVGYSLGSSFSARKSFSGVRVKLNTNESTTSTPTTIGWDTTEFNVNADINGKTYWSITNADKINVSTNGYYRIKSLFNTGVDGTTDSYNVDVKLNGATLESASLSPLDSLSLDEVYNFTSGSYLQVYVKNNNSVGTIVSSSYFELTMVGV